MTLSHKTLQVDGLTIGYWEDGDNQGRTLLLVHGGVGDAQLHWGPVMPLLAENFHVLAPDLPGFGHSQPLPRMRTASLMHWFSTFLDHLKIEQAVVIGNSSLGSLFVRLFAAANPKYVPAVILVNGGVIPYIPSVLRAVERVPGLSNGMFFLFGKSAMSVDTLKKMIHVQDILTDDFLQKSQITVPAFSKLMRMLVSSPMPTLHAPLLPTLILWGANDQVATLKDAEAIKDSIPGAVLTEIAECGHMPQLETPDVFVWQVNTFLDKLSRQGHPASPGPGILPNLSG
jgi:pimeloyl-ACP methyl ester carboxylesterase